MPIEVQLDDQILEFPDDMSDNDIKSVLRKRFPSRETPAFDDPLMASAAMLALPEDFQVESPSRGVFTAAGGPQIRTPGDGSFGRDVAEGVRRIPETAGQVTQELVRPMLAPFELEPEQSVLGPLREAVPTGARMTEAIGLPQWLTIPTSGVVKTIAGLGEFATSPVGAAEMGISAIPGIGLLQRAKFVKDMAEGAGQSAGTISPLVERALQDPSSVTTEDAQQIAEGTADSALMLLGAGKLTSSQFAQLTGVRAPVGRFLETDRTRISKDVAEMLKRSEPSPIPEAAPNPQRGLATPRVLPAFEPFARPEIQALAGEALREAQGPRIEVPGELSALETLRREIEPPRVELAEPTRLAERVEGGGEAPYGKTSFMREAEAPTTERTQNAISTESAPILRPVQQPQVTQESAGQVPVAESRPQAAEALADPIVSAAYRTPSGEIISGLEGREMSGVTHMEANIAAKERGINVSEDMAGFVTKSGKFLTRDQALDYAKKSKQAEPDAGEVMKGELHSSEVKGLGEAAEASKPEVATRPQPAETDDATPSQIRKLRESSKNVESSAPTTTVGIPSQVVTETVGSVLSAKPSDFFSQSEKWSKEAMSPEGGVNPQFRAELIALRNPDVATWQAALSKATSDFAEIRDRAKADPSLMNNRDFQREFSGAAQKAQFFSEGLAVLDGRKAPDARTLEMFNRESTPFREPEKIAEGQELKLTIPEYQDLQYYRNQGFTPEQSLEMALTISGRTATPSKPNIISKLESLKFPDKGEGRLYSLPHPDAILAIGRSTWNSAVDVAILAVKAGKKLSEAIDDALAYLRRQGKTFDEAKARANFEYQVRGEARATPPPSKPPTTATAAPAAPAPKGATLDDVYKIFEPAPKAKPGVKETAVKAIESIRTGFSSRFRPIDKLAEDIAKEYGVPSRKGIAGIFEQLKGSSGKAEADIYRFDRDVSNRLRGSEKDFSAYLFLRRSLDRLNQDIADIQAGRPARRAVSTYTIPELQSKLAALESKIGAEKLKTFQETADLYQQYMDRSLRLQVESGRMSQEIYDAIKEGNSFYAPFKVLKYFEEGIKPEGTGRKIDTVADFTKAMEGIESPDFKLGDMLGAARQNIALSRILAEKNNTMRKFADLADQDINRVFTQKLGPKQEAPVGMEVVNVLRNGKQERYAVNRDVAQAVQLFGNAANTFAARVLQAFGVPFRLGATALNIPFQFSNLLADAPRAALVSRYGIRGVQDLIRYPLDMIDALYSSMLGNVVGYKNKLFLDFLDSGAAGTTIQEYLTPQGLKFQRNSIPETIAKKALYSLPDFAQAIEQMSKVLGVKRAMRITGAESGKELAAKFPEAVTEIRRFSGSPDFGRQGRWVEEARLNLLYMFLNARIQGTTADLGRLLGRDGAREAALMWGKMGLAVGVPTAYLYSLNRSSEYADDYDKRPKQEKENYWLIPKDSFITNEQGEKMRDYWRIPKRESAKWIANSLEAAMDFAEKKDTATFANWAETMMEEITPVNIQGDTFPQRLESVGASLNPVIKAPLEMATGRDMYRHRDIVPEMMQKASPSEQYTDRTAEVFKSLASAMPDVLPEVFQSPIMLESMVRNLSAGLVTQFLPRRPIEGRGQMENTPLLQRFQALPYTDQEKFREEIKQLEREAADEQVRRYRNANNFVREHKSLSIEDKARLAAQTYKGDVRQIERIIDLLIAERNGITNQERQILALPVVQRAQYIADQISGMNPDQRTAIIREYARKRILTEGVAQELVKLLNPQ